MSNTPNPPRNRMQSVARKVRSETVEWQAKFNLAKTDLLYDLNAYTQDLKNAEAEFQKRAADLDQRVQKFQELTNDSVYSLSLDFIDFTNAISDAEGVTETVASADPS
jgi:hypothetical protein